MPRMWPVIPPSPQPLAPAWRQEIGSRGHFVSLHKRNLPTAL